MIKRQESCNKRVITRLLGLRPRRQCDNPYLKKLCCDSVAKSHGGVRLIRTVSMLYMYTCAVQKYIPLYIGQIHAVYFDPTPYTLNDVVNTNSIGLNNVIVVCLWYCIEMI